MAARTPGIRKGTPAPDFSWEAEDGSQQSLHDFRGRLHVVISFYPRDFTPGCTRQACSYRDHYRELQALGAVLLGISPDPPAVHRRFRASFGLPYILVSDAGQSISRLYGIRWLGGLVPFGRRMTFVVDKAGIVRRIIHHEFAVTRHLEEALDALRELQEER